MVAEWDADRRPSEKPLTMCDECGKFVENFAYHYDRVHPSADRQAERERERAQQRTWRQRRRRPAG